jgi:hypothetical protein
MTDMREHTCEHRQTGIRKLLNSTDSVVMSSPVWLLNSHIARTAIDHGDSVCRL